MKKHIVVTLRRVEKAVDVGVHPSTLAKAIIDSVPTEDLKQVAELPFVDAPELPMQLEAELCMKIDIVKSYNKYPNKIIYSKFVEYINLHDMWPEVIEKALSIHHEKWKRSKKTEKPKKDDMVKRMRERKDIVKKQKNFQDAHMEDRLKKLGITKEDIKKVTYKYKKRGFE